jgi:hypothetical protein
MTIIVASVAEDLAFMGCDTRISFEDPIRHAAKMMPLPHMRAVVGHSGKVLHSGVLFSSCMECCSDFDELLERLPGIAHRCLREWPMETRYTAIAVGYSAKAARFIGRVWQAAGAEDPFLVHDIGAGEFACSIDWLDPRWSDKTKNLPAPGGPQSMAMFAKGMVRAVNDHYPGMCGGTFSVAQIHTDGSMTIRPVCEL